MNAEAERALRAVATQFEATREDLERIALSLTLSPVPRVGSFAEEVKGLLVGRTFATYSRHLDRIIEDLGDLRLDEVTLLELERLAIDVRREALAAGRAQHGFGAEETFVNTCRFLFVCAVKAGHLRESPATGLCRPRRRRTTRRALAGSELAGLFDAVLTTSRDPDLDLLILAFARETACRREGILNLGSVDLQPTPSVVLYEKFDEHREIPVTARLLDALRAHHAQRAPDCDRIFHYSDGTCLTERRFDSIFRRAGRELPWVRTLGVSLHWLRYSTLTDIRMIAGERVAAAYAGHADGAGGITALYTRATFAELQEAHRRLFGTREHQARG